MNSTEEIINFLVGDSKDIPLNLTPRLREAPRAFAEELKSFKKNTVRVLNPVVVHYANRALHTSFGFQVHGYAVVSSKPATIRICDVGFPKVLTPGFKRGKTRIISSQENRSPTLKTEFSRVFYLGPSRLHGRFDVSDKLIMKAKEQKDIFTDSQLETLKQFRHQTFPTGEHFLRHFLYALENPINEEKRHHLNRLAANPETAMHLTLNHLDPDFVLCKALDKLIKLNIDANKNYGIVLPFASEYTKNYQGERIVYDRYAFDHNQSTNAIYMIDPCILYEVFQQQMLFQRYLEEKLNIGESVDPENKSAIIQSKHTAFKRLVTFAETGIFDDLKTANCNKALGTILQEAETLSAKTRTPDKIKGASYSAFGATARMFLWNTSLHQLMINLFVASNKNFSGRLAFLKDKKIFKQLAENKTYFLNVVETWPREQQQKAYEQIFNPESPLGNLFMRDPNGELLSPEDYIQQLKPIRAKYEKVLVWDMTHSKSTWHACAK